MNDRERYEERNQPSAVECRDGMLWVTLKDGRVIGTPLEWYPRLRDAVPEQLAHVELMADGVHWPDLDEDLSVMAMVNGYRPPANPR